MALLTDITKDQIIHIERDGVLVKIKVLKKSGSKVRIHIDAPKDMDISKRDLVGGEKPLK